MTENPLFPPLASGDANGNENFSPELPDEIFGLE
jgi:hypothetical protein